MGQLQKDMVQISVLSYIGVVFGYLNKGVLFVLFLEAHQIGLINLILAVAGLYAQFANLGSLNATWRFFPVFRNKEKKHYGFLLFVLIIALVGASFFALVFYLFTPQIAEYYSEHSETFIDYIYWVIPSGIAILLYKLFDGYFRGLFKSVYSVAINEVLTRILTTLLLCLFIFEWIPFRQLVISVCLVQWVPVILQIIYLQRTGEWNMKLRDINISRKMKKIIFKYATYGYLNTMGATLSLTIDTLMVAGMLGLSETGVYTTVIFISRALIIPHASILRVSSPLVPLIQKERNMAKLKKLYVQVSSVSLVIGLFLFLGVWVNRFELFSFLPPEFEAGIDVFFYLMMGRLVDMYFGLNGVILQSSSKYKYDFYFTLCLTLLVIGLNLLFIPLWGLSGAAISTMITFIVYNSVRGWFVWKAFGLHPFNISQFKVIGLAIVLLFFFEWFSFGSGSPFLSIIIKSILIAIFFMGTIYFFKLEEETVNYIDKIKKKLFR